MNVHRPGRGRSRLLTGIALAGCMALLGACGGGSSGKSASGAQVIRVTYPANVSNVPLRIALQQGFFAQEGLEVRGSEDLGAGSTIEAIAGGQVDMAWANTVSGLTAYTKGIRIRLAAITDTSVSGSQQVLVAKDSKAAGLADLSGKKLAVLAPTTICILNVRSALKELGLPQDSIRFTPIAPPEHANVLSSGEVAATCTSDPFRSQMIDKLGAKPIFDANSGELAGSPIGGYAVSESFAKAHPKEIGAFRRALVRANRFANAHPEVVREMLVTFGKVDPAVAQKVMINRFLEAQDPATLTPLVQRVATAMNSYGLSEKTIDVGSYLAAAN